jgi:cobalamin biosynthesis protein CbiG
MIYAFTPQGLKIALRLLAALPFHLCLPLSLQSAGPEQSALDIAACRSDRSALRQSGGRDLQAYPGGTGGHLPGRSALIPVEPGRLIFFERLSDCVAENFHRCKAHIFISAAGIAVRAVAPLLVSKRSDPAVLLVDQAGRHVISLLSGHLGGANALALRAAEILGAEPVITTATDLEDLPAIDLLAEAAGLVPSNPEALGKISAALLAGRKIDLFDPDNRLGLIGGPREKHFRVLARPPGAGKPCGGPSSPAVVVDVHLPCAGFLQNELRLHPPLLYAGIGCRRGVSATAIRQALLEVLRVHGLAAPALAGIASISAKSGESGLLEAAAGLGLPLEFFSPAELAEFPVRSPSAKALEVFGVAGVCESAALALATKAGGLSGPGAAVLAVPKQISGGVTVAVAKIS